MNPIVRQLTVKQVAAELNYSLDTIYHMIERRDIESTRYGRSVRIPIRAVEKLISKITLPEREVHSSPSVRRHRGKSKSTIAQNSSPLISTISVSNSDLSGNQRQDLHWTPQSPV